MQTTTQKQIDDLESDVTKHIEAIQASVHQLLLDGREKD